VTKIAWGKKRLFGSCPKYWNWAIDGLILILALINLVNLGDLIIIEIILDPVLEFYIPIIYIVCE